MSWTQLGSNIIGENAFDYVGCSLSLSGNGQTVIVGARDNDGGGTNVGHARVYSWSGSAWVQKGQDIDPEQTSSSRSGWAVAISTDGLVIAVSDVWNDGSGADAGSVRVYSWNSGTNLWVKRGNDLDGEAAGDNSGYAVSLNNNGTVVAISSTMNGGNARGHVRVYSWNSSSWIKLGGDIDGPEWGQSGKSVSLSSDGYTVAIGGPVIDNGAAYDTGAVTIYKYESSAWVLKITIYGETAFNYSGSECSVSLSSDASIIAIGAYGNDGTTGNASDDRGHTRIFQLNYTNSTYTQRGSDIDGEAAGDQSGISVSLNTDGTVVAIGAHYNDGTTGTASDNRGSTRVYGWNGSTWTQRGSDIDGTAANNNSGLPVSISSDGSIVAISSVAGGNGFVKLFQYGSPPTLSNFTIPTKQYGDAPFTLTAPTSNSSGAITYTSATTSVATISGNTITILSVGSTVITATQAASGSYGTGSITATLTVNKATPTLTNFSIATKQFGDAPFTLTAPTSNSTGAFTYSSSDTTVATISGNTATVIGGGSTTITATQATTTNYATGTITAILTVGIDPVCFLRGTRITCLDEETGGDKEVEIENLRPGKFVKTYAHGYVPVNCIGYSMLPNPTNTDERIQERLYRLTPERYPTLTRELIITGCHAVLEDELTEEQTEQTVQILEDIFITDDKYRLIAMIDERAEIYETEEEASEIWHLCLEHEDDKMNYGIYANGLLVESCCKCNLERVNIFMVEGTYRGNLRFPLTPSLEGT